MAHEVTHISGGRLQKEHDWTPGAIKTFLGEPDTYYEMPNPYKRGAGNISVPMYLLSRVSAVEQIPAYKSWRAKRQATRADRVARKEYKQAAHDAEYHDIYRSLSLLRNRAFNENTIDPAIITEYFDAVEQAAAAKPDAGRRRLLYEIRHEILIELLSIARDSNLNTGCVPTDLPNAKPGWRDIVIDSPFGQIRMPIYGSMFNLPEYVGLLDERNHTRDVLIRFSNAVIEAAAPQSHNVRCMYCRTTPAKMVIQGKEIAFDRWTKDGMCTECHRRMLAETAAKEAAEKELSLTAA
jgi:hypothetical protein